MNFKILIDEERCKGCMYCIEACPQSVLIMSKNMNSKGYHFPEVVREETCNGCRRCASMCPDMAIKIRKIRAETHSTGKTGRK